MTTARPDFALPASESSPAGVRAANGTAASRPGGLVDHTFHASCRPHSWSLFGVHMRMQARCGAGRATGPGRARAGEVALRGEEAAAASLVAAARAMGRQLGNGRLWLWCAGQVPSSRFLTLLAGHAGLSNVSRASLGLELSAHALDRAGEAEVRRLDELRSAGIGVLVRLGVRPGLPGVSDPQLLARVQRAHERGWSALASDVSRREFALPLGEAGFAAISGPVVCEPTNLAGVLKFIGPAEPWLVRMRADSL